MRNREVSMKYVKGGESGWTQVVIRKRKKSVRSEDVDNSQNANIRLNLIEGRSLVRYREVNRIPGIYICGCLQVLRWVAVKLARSHQNYN